MDRTRHQNWFNYLNLFAVQKLTPVSDSVPLNASCDDSSQLAQTYPSTRSSLLPLSARLLTHPLATNLNPQTIRCALALAHHALAGRHVALARPASRSTCLARCSSGRKVVLSGGPHSHLLDKSASGARTRPATSKTDTPAASAATSHRQHQQHQIYTSTSTFRQQCELQSYRSCCSHAAHTLPQVTLLQRHTHHPPRRLGIDIGPRCPADVVMCNNS